MFYSVVASQRHPNLCITMYYYVLLCVHVFFFAHRHFFSSGHGSFLVLSAPAHAGSPPEHLGPSVGLGRGPWQVLWGFKVERNHGEAFRARRAIQAHANPCTGLKKNVRRFM